jgi:OmpA-OmpF porin, OOP family
VKAKEITGSVILKGVNFKTGSAELTFESGAILDEVVTSLQAYPDVCIEIRGHTDDVGPRVKNKELSLARANSVKAYFVSKGIASNRIKTDGFGPKQPSASNKTDEGRAQNRRIEMYRVSCQ